MKLGKLLGFDRQMDSYSYEHEGNNKIRVWMPQKPLDVDTVMIPVPLNVYDEIFEKRKNYKSFARTSEFITFILRLNLVYDRELVTLTKDEVIDEK